MLTLEGIMWDDFQLMVSDEVEELRSEKSLTKYHWSWVHITCYLLHCCIHDILTNAIDSCTLDGCSNGHRWHIV